MITEKNKIKLTMNTDSLTQKPDKKWFMYCKNIGKDNSSMNKEGFFYNNVIEITPQDFKKAIASGHAFHPAVFEIPKNIEAWSKNNKGKSIYQHRACKDYFKETSIICLDIDNDAAEEDENASIITYKDIATRLNKYSLSPLCIYASYSNMKKKKKNSDELLPKFRIVFRLKETITRENVRKWDTLMLMLSTLFPENDKSNKNIDRIFLGTYGEENILHFNEFATLNEVALLNGFIDSILNENVVKNRNEERELKKYAALIGINYNKGFDIDIDNDNHIIKINFQNNYNSKFLDYTNYTEGQIKNNSKPSNPKKIVNFTPSKEELDRQIYTMPRKKDLHKELLDKSNFYKKAWNGIIKVGHSERLYLITNLMFIEGGKIEYMRLIRRILELKKHNYNDTEAQYEKEYNDCSKIAYLPQNNQTFGYSSYLFDNEYGFVEDECYTFNTLFGCISARGFEPVRVKQIPKAPRERQEFLLNASLALNTIDNPFLLGHFLQKAQTGLGKTESIMKSHLEYYKRVLYSAPTHNLCGEIEERMNSCEQKEFWGDIIRIPERPQLPDGDKKDKYNKLLKAGYTAEANDLWKSYYSKLENQTQEYLSFIEAKETSKAAHITIATHSRVMFMTEKELDSYDLIIFDEDICQQVICQTSAGEKLNFSDVKAFVNTFPKVISHAGEVRRFIDEIDKYNFPIVQEELGGENQESYPYIFYNKLKTDLLKINLASRKDRDNIPAANIIDFFTCECYMINGKGNIRYSYVNDFKEKIKNHKKTITMSATICEEVWKSIFEGGKLLLNLLPCENEGKLIQVMDKSFSKSYLKNNFEEAIEIIEETLVANGVKKEDCVFITYKDYIDKLKDNGFNTIPHKNKGQYMSFGNTAGSDILSTDKYKNKHLLVIGKFSYDEVFIKLFAGACGIKMPTDIRIRQETTIDEIHGVKSKIMTFPQEELRNIHYYLLESEASQSCGRARLVRNGRKCFYFSNYPLIEADIQLFKGNKIREVFSIKEDEHIKKTVSLIEF